MTDLNRRLHPCKGCTLPAELIAHMVEDMGIEPICFPECKSGDHPLQSHPPHKIIFHNLISFDIVYKVLLIENLLKNLIL